MAKGKDTKEVGRPKNFETPEALKKAWEEFKEDLKIQATNWPKVQYVGKDGERKVDYPVLPYTLEGFKRFCRDKYGEVEQYFTNQDNCYTQFIGICRAIKEEIREQQIIGGMLGAYNPSITQRLNGLTDKQELAVSGVKTILTGIDPPPGE